MNEHRATERAWTVVLDGLERRLDRQAAFVDDEHGTVDIESVTSPFEAPVDLGPLPDSLRDRATELLDRNNRMIGRVRARLADAPTPPATPVARRPRPVPSASSSTIDVQA